MPSLSANSETSGPSRYSSTSTACPASSTARPWARRPLGPASDTPLPAASPSSLTTYGPRGSAQRPRPAPSPARPGHRPAGRGGGHARGGHHVLGERLAALELGGLRRRAEAGDARVRTASAAPATSGTSGPTTTRSARHSPGRAHATASGSADVERRAASASARVPALPGAHASAVTARMECRAGRRERAPGRRNRSRGRAWTPTYRRVRWPRIRD